MHLFGKIYACLIVGLLMTGCGFAQSTTVRIRFLNGKTGKPLPVKYMKIGAGGYEISGYIVEKVEKYGLLVTFKNTTSFAFRDEGYYRCDTNVQTSPAIRYNLEEIAEHGVVAPNVCGKPHDQPVRDELIVYSRRAHFWEAVGNLRGLFICG